MDTPSGMTPARVTKRVTRHQTDIGTLRRAVAVIVIWLAAAGAPLLHAQEELTPKPAIMAPLATSSLLLDVAVAGDALVAVGERGHVLVSTDEGATWQQSEVPTQSMLCAVFFHDASLGWAVGHDSVIIRTTDGGKTWEIVNWAPEDETPLFDVWFADADNGFAIGAYGTFLVTSDGGDTWEWEPLSDDDWHLHKFAADDAGRFFIAAEAGFVYRSDDGGDTWTDLPSPYEGSYFGILPLGGDTLLLFGLRGHLFRTEDAGESWQEIETATVAMLNDGVLLEDGTVIIVGLGGTVLMSSDGGRTFDLHRQANRRGISSIVQTADDTVLLAGEFGVKTVRTGSLAETTG
jgi:photosystem II stability/assembly factor-like uncharacterized protein